MFSHGVAPLSMLGGVVVSRFLAPKLRTRMLRSKMQQLDAESATTGDADVVDGPVCVRPWSPLGGFHNVLFVLPSSRDHGITSLLY